MLSQLVMATAAAMLLTVASAASSETVNCNSQTFAAGSCSAWLGDGVTLAGTQTTEGGSSSPGGADAASGPPAGAGPAPLSPEEVAEQEKLLQDIRDRCEDGIARQAQGVAARFCEFQRPGEDGAADASVAAAPPAPITVRDLASFRPEPGELVSEPGGWAAVGTPSNFYATSAMHAQNGDLFGALVTVRWVPVSYSFDYGDGHRATLQSGGRAWRDGEEWSETASSHVFETRDDVTVTATTEFAADVNAGGGWVRVPGTLNVEAPSEYIKVFEVKTVLTAGDCIQQPESPGCN